jgi:hypothetical protein
MRGGRTIVKTCPRNFTFMLKMTTKEVKKHRPHQNNEFISSHEFTLKKIKQNNLLFNKKSKINQLIGVIELGWS